MLKSKAQANEMIRKQLSYSWLGTEFPYVGNGGLNKVNSSIPLFNSNKSILLKQIRVTNQNRGNTSTVRGNQLDNRNTELLQKQTPINIYRNGLFDKNCHIPGTGHFKKKWWVAPGFMATQIPLICQC